MMKSNVGNSDRFIRVIIGLVVIAAGVFYQSYWAVIGAIPLVTGLIGWCPAYLAFGISTCEARSDIHDKKTQP